MPKETETKETIVLVVTFLSLVAFHLGELRPPAPPHHPGYAYKAIIIEQNGISCLIKILSVNHALDRQKEWNKKYRITRNNCFESIRVK